MQKTQPNDEHGTVDVTVQNLVNARKANFKVNPKWTMDKVRELAYTHTKDERRANDRFTGTDENKAIEGATLQQPFEQVTAPNGFLPGERNFYIRGPVGGACRTHPSW